jgi:hypothetical protein
MNRNILIAAAAALMLAPAAGFAAEKATEKAPPSAKAEKAAPAPKAEPAPPAAKAEPAPKPEAAKPASVSIAPPAEKMASADKPRRGPSRANEDARECLGQPTNREVAICAEKFR